jgi:hypothetical protein
MLALASTVEIPADPTGLADEIARTAACLDAATHRLLTCIRAFDESGDWERQGAVSCAAWLTWRIGLDRGAAREKVRVARALGHLPRLDDALRRGVLSYAKARALTRVATPENEEQLLTMAHATTGAQLERLCRKLRRVVDVIEGGDRLDDRRYVRDEVLENGMVRISAVLHPDEAALVMKAIEQARRASVAPPAANDVSAETRPPALIPMADALVSVAEGYLAHGDATGGGGERTQIFLHVDQDPLAPDGVLAATLDDGTRVSAETLRRLSCDSSLVPILHAAQGKTIDVGRRTRTISPALRRALWIRDRGCRFPACTNHLYLHGHHIAHWAHGGPTSADNLVLVCSRHHRLLHEGGFTARRVANGEVVFLDAHGRCVEDAPAATDVGKAWGDTMRRWIDEAGGDIDEQTNFPAWDGERVDYEAAVDAVVG